MDSGDAALTMAMGYSERQDKVIVYEFLLRDKTSAEPAAPQTWMYRFNDHRQES
jgi:hypothetical protein